MSQKIDISNIFFECTCLRVNGWPNDGRQTDAKAETTLFFFFTFRFENNEWRRKTYGRYDMFCLIVNVFFFVLNSSRKVGQLLFTLPYTIPSSHLTTTNTFFWLRSHRVELYVKTNWITIIYYDVLLFFYFNNWLFIKTVDFNLHFYYC